MTEAIARRMLLTAGYTAEERRLARLWMTQRRLFPGSSRHVTDDRVSLSDNQKLSPQSIAELAGEGAA